MGSAQTIGVGPGASLVEVRRPEGDLGMAHTYFYSNVTAVVADPDGPRRQVIRSTLHYLGLREVEWCDSLAELHSLCESRKPDLVLAALDLSDGPASQYFQDVRRGRCSVDPFTPIIAVLSEASPETVRRGIDCGADDLLIHPWPTGYLDGRMEKLIHARKPFVVSADYVGPDRRARDRDGPRAQQLTPPNVLEAKALRRQSSETVAEALSASRTALEQHRLHAVATLAVRLVDEVEALYARGQMADALVPVQLERIRAAADEASLLAMKGAAATAAAGFRDLARHAGLCRDAQQHGRVASLVEMARLRDAIAGFFKIETALLLDKPAAAALPRPPQRSRAAVG